MDRIPVEENFGNAKRKYSMVLIMTKGKETTETTIGVIFIVMNLEELRARFLFALFLLYNWGRKNDVNNSISLSSIPEYIEFYDLIP